MELRFKLEEQYKFPAFESWQWRAAIYYTKKLKDLNSTIDVNLLQGIKYLKETLKRWLKEVTFKFIKIFSEIYSLKR